MIPKVTAIEDDLNIFEEDPTTNNHCRTNMRLSTIEMALNMVTEPNEVDNRLMFVENAIAGGTTIDPNSGEKVLNYDTTTLGNVKDRLSTDNTKITTIASDIGLIFGATGTDINLHTLARYN